MAIQCVSDVCIKAAAGGGGSSRVWLCATSHTDGQPKTVVYVVDAHNPASPLETFSMPSTHILCIASVPSTCCTPAVEITFVILCSVRTIVVVAHFAITLSKHCQ